VKIYEREVVCVELCDIPAKESYQIGTKIGGGKMKEYHYFVAHGFSKQERDDLREAIEKAFKGTGLNAYYADIEIRQTHILEKIKERILGTSFGIYDITHIEKPNIFLELGLAMGSERPFYIMCKKGTKIPADLAGLDRIEYESYKELTHLLKTKVVQREINKLKWIGKSGFFSGHEIKWISDMLGVEVIDRSYVMGPTRRLIDYEQIIKASKHFVYCLGLTWRSFSSGRYADLFKTKLSLPDFELRLLLLT
jgi:hypothetical protein